jgi:hypothetical protein
MVNFCAMLGFLARGPIARKVGIFGFALIVEACGVPDSWDGLVPIPTRTDAATFRLRFAQTFWNRHIGRHVVRDAAKGERAVEIHWDATLGTNTNGCWHPEDGDVVRVAPGSDETTIAHELGHAMGLYHDWEAGSIMNETGCLRLDDECVVPEWQIAEVLIRYELMEVHDGGS